MRAHGKYQRGVFSTKTAFCYDRTGIDASGCVFFDDIPYMITTHGLIHTTKKAEHHTN